MTSFVRWRDGLKARCVKYRLIDKTRAKETYAKLVRLIIGLLHERTVSGTTLGEYHVKNSDRHVSNGLFRFIIGNGLENGGGEESCANPFKNQ